jgi:glycosyltransferase involved in cell wall biosynthesis
MIIGIDGNEINIERRVGVNVYGFELLWNLWKLKAEWKDKHNLIVYLKEKPRDDMPKETKNFKYRIIPGGGMWILTRLMPDLFFGKPRPDIFFSPSHYAAPFAPMPRIISIMDLGYLESSGQFTKIVFWQLKWWTAISIFVSKRIIAISNATKADIVRHYPFAESKIRVTPLAYDSSRFNDSISDKDVRRIKNKYSIVTDYILYLGTLKPSKNIEGLVEAFSKVADDFPKVKLVVAGKKGWLYETIFKKAEDLGIKDKIVFTDFVSDEEKAILRKGAKVFVQPSFWEGFGIDTLSAMAMGVPVVVSDTGSLPEVVGDAGILVDPKSTDSIAGGIKKVLSMSKTDYNKLVEKGLRQAAKFSWERTARETLKILEAAKA